MTCLYLLLACMIIFMQEGNARVRFKPRIKKETKRIFYVRQNDTVQLPCKVKRQYEDVERKIVFYWKKQTKPRDIHIKVDLPRHNVIFNKYLEIVNIHSTDHGNYTCRAINRYGDDQSILSLVVIDRDVTVIDKVPTKTSLYSTPFPRPNFFNDHLSVISPVKYKSFTLGKQAKLKCHVKGSPAPSVKWYHNGVWLTPSSRFGKSKKGKVLRIKSFLISDVGNYTCVAMNGEGEVNMTIVVNHYIPYRPVKKDITLTVKPGENITLTCEVLVDVVKYVHWLLPKALSLQNSQRTTSTDLQKDDAFHGFPREDNSFNTTRIEKFMLYNISEAVHAGSYICQATFVNGDKLYSVKEYKLQFVKKEIVLTPKSSEKLITITLSAFAVVLSFLFIVGLCMRCHRKQRKMLGQHSTIPTTEDDTIEEDDGEDTISLQILTKQPHGSLTIHRKSTDETNQYSSRTNFIDYNEITTLERRVKIEKDNTVNNNLPCPMICDGQSECPEPRKESLVRKSESPIQKVDSPLQKCRRRSDSDNVRKTSSKTWPGQKLLPNDPDYISFNDNDILLCSDRTNKYRKTSLEGESCTYNKKKNSENMDRMTPTSHHSNHDDDDDESYNTTPKYHHCHSGVIDDNIPPLMISDSPEEEDQLLQREMKMWEPLIKNSISSFTYNKNEKDQTMKLLNKSVDSTSHLIL